MSSEDGAEGGSGSVAKSATGPRFKDKPVKPGDEMDVTISEMSKKGDGVTKVQGYVVFIPGGKQGQQTRIRVTKITPNFAIAEMVGAAAEG